MSTSTPDGRFVVLLPVKRPVVAKSRLLDLGDRVRRDLVVAFAADTATAALESPLVTAVLAVTDDFELADGLRGLGVQVIPDGTVDDLNGSLLQAAAEAQRRWPGAGLVAICADLPALRSSELTSALSRAATTSASFVADADMVGTTTLVAPDLDLFTPRFGPHSRRAHLEAGAREIDLDDVPGLRRDVDTPDDLRAAVELGVRARTSAIITTLRL
ncbi:MAG: 2-phospho-L-lactate guanylyltransferase [Actinomycetota bacterium]|nr:2-phospho-L-lactate guanylyltransferase [Actinomycetota bacterium]